MKTHHIKSIQEMESLCAEVRPDDGIAPHVLKKQQSRAEHRTKPLPARALQYQKAVRQCLDSAFASVCVDPLLVDLVVVAVEPIGRGAKLLVVVETPPSNEDNPQMIETALQQAAGHLRSVVAGEIPRKRTPYLSFRVVPGATGYPENG
ncbi:MAG: hypothetical protein ABI600_08950 [Luteolibacter sp.]